MRACSAEHFWLGGSCLAGGPTNQPLIGWSESSTSSPASAGSMSSPAKPEKESDLAPPLPKPAVRQLPSPRFPPPPDAWRRSRAPSPLLPPPSLPAQGWEMRRSHGERIFLAPSPRNGSTERVFREFDRGAGTAPHEAGHGAVREVVPNRVLVPPRLHNEQKTCFYVATRPEQINPSSF